MACKTDTVFTIVKLGFLKSQFGRFTKKSPQPFAVYNE
jgi:hypothetical protein